MNEVSCTDFIPHIPSAPFPSSAHSCLHICGHKQLLSSSHLLAFSQIILLFSVVLAQVNSNEA